MKLGLVPDLFLIHNPFVPENNDVVGAWKVLEELKDEGKLKSIGVSNFRPQDFEALFAAKVKYVPVVNQVRNIIPPLCGRSSHSRPAD